MAFYIRNNYILTFKKFKKVSLHKDLCSKLDAPFQFDLDNIDECFRNFKEQFSDKNNCKKCKLSSFLESYSNTIETIRNNKNLVIEGSNKKGFSQIISALEKDSKLTCTYCKKIGDLIIALNCPENMRLETTDYAYDYLMKILNKSHFRHPTESKLYKEDE